MKKIIKNGNNKKIMRKPDLKESLLYVKEFIVLIISLGDSIKYMIL